MPLHPSRLVERGFNQSHEIARIVSRLLDLRLAGKGLRRIRSTAPQVGLTRQQRAGNLSGAFAADSSLVAGQHVVLIDDVVTTGSTAIEAASTLRAAGAESIAVWAVARALGSSGREDRSASVKLWATRARHPHAPPYLRFRLRRPA